MVNPDHSLEWHKHKWVIKKRYRFFCFVWWRQISEPLHWKRCLFHLKHLTKQEQADKKKYQFVFRPKRSKKHNTQ